MKFLAFFLALLFGFIIWAIPATIIININKANAIQNGAIIYTLIMFIIVYGLIWLVKKLYKFFLKKFGYEIIEKKKDK